jgi:Uma2 family endonuclease
MPEPVVRRATYEDVINAPPHRVAEILLGTLHVQPRPTFGHINVNSALGPILGHHYQFLPDGTCGEWSFLYKPELHLGDEPDVIVPELAAWKRERKRDVPRDAPWLTVAPDWACEVLSPETEPIDRGVKMEIYHREQVSHLWLIDPIGLCLEVYRRRDMDWVRVAEHRGDANVRAEPFAAAEIQLRRLWEL